MLFVDHNPILDSPGGPGMLGAAAVPPRGGLRQTRESCPRLYTVAEDPATVIHCQGKHRSVCAPRGTAEFHEKRVGPSPRGTLLLYRIVRRLPRDRDVMGMRLAQPCRRDPHELRLCSKILHGAAADVAHSAAQSTDHLI